jgi:hypothetical protein
MKSVIKTGLENSNGRNKSDFCLKKTNAMNPTQPATESDQRIAAPEQQLPHAVSA